MHALQPLNSGGIAKVAATNNDSFSVGDIVSGWFDWANYTTVAQGAGLTKIDKSADLPLSYHLGALGETSACLTDAAYPQNGHSCLIHILPR